ncbi:C69 family dipeptidase [Lactiplantibacillus daowaiensis]|uniref:Dipeptidase n=1 Tax=Lactiplantibacillus daowaiensis TaxID=2559918 RepID=A0ABW1S4I0_9LACO|nr:C69 family dipeptidase [Lactiplantibacillus daowaiensis]
MKKSSDCTEILVGKAATIDGSTIVARNEDGYGPINPINFVVHAAADQPNATYTSVTTGVTVPLPDHAYRYTATPQADQSDGQYEEAGINEFNVGMSATETTATNPRVLGYDPLVTDGVDEEAMVSLVLPYIKTAKEGVQRLGALLEKYGTGESNSIAFNDHNDIWILETAGGHHWGAMRLPDDTYAIVPNQTVVQTMDLTDTNNFLGATDLLAFVDNYHLNPNPDSFNFRTIFGTHGEDDAYYNTPRTWYGQKLFNPEIEQQPTAQDMPMCRKPSHQLAIEDVQAFLSSHYNGTPYDPFGTYASGSEADQRKYRPIAMDRNQCSSILQIRNDVPADRAAIQWVAMGFFAYAPYMPFFTNINDTPIDYRNASADVDVNNVYWLNKTLSVLIEPHWHDYAEAVNAFKNGCQSYARGRVAVTDAAVSDGDVTTALTQANQATASEISSRTHQLFDTIVKHGLNLSKTAWEKGQNL